jgi:hypothetical protein
VRRILEEGGFDVTDPVEIDGDERGIMAEYLAAHETTVESERGSDDILPGDVAAAVNGYRAVFAHMVTTRSSADATDES